MNEQTKSLIRHAIVTISSILGLLGLDKYLPIFDFLQSALDAVWGAVTLLVGFVLTLVGFFKDKERFAIRTGSVK